MVNPFLRHDAHEKGKDDWTSTELDDDDDDLTEALSMPTDIQMGSPFTTFSPPWPSSYPDSPNPSAYLYNSWESKNPRSTLQTSTYSLDPSPYSEHLAPTTASTLVASNNSPESTSTNSDGYGPEGPADWDRKGPNHGLPYAVVGVVPVVVIAFIAFIVFFYLRKRKRQRTQQAAAQARMQELKRRNQPFVAARYTSAPPSPPPPAQPLYAVPPSHPPPPASPTSPQPVIIGPIESGSNGAYFTGIDTSDVVSMHDRSGLGNPFADGDSLHEEPPPPYRPRSIAPSSRNSSLRVPPSAHTRTSLIANQNQPVRSPFADPSEDDAVSDASAPATRRNRDTLSVVSDLSYQEDPVVARPSV